MLAIDAAVKEVDEGIDVKIKCGGQLLTGCRNMLLQDCQLFQFMLFNNLGSVSTDQGLIDLDVKPTISSAVLAMMQFVNTGELDFSQHDIASLLEAAEVLKMPIISTLCCCILLESVTASSLVKTWQLLQNYNKIEFLQDLYENVAIHFEQFAEFPEILEVPFTLLVHILQRVDPKLSFLNFLNFLSKWMKFSLAERQNQMYAVVSAINFSMTSNCVLMHAIEHDAFVQQCNAIRESLSFTLKNSFWPRQSIVIVGDYMKEDMSVVSICGYMMSSKELVFAFPIEFTNPFLHACYDKNIIVLVAENRITTINTETGTINEHVNSLKVPAKTATRAVFSMNIVYLTIGQGFYGFSVLHGELIKLEDLPRLPNDLVLAAVKGEIIMVGSDFSICCYHPAINLWDVIETGEKHEIDPNPNSANRKLHCFVVKDTIYVLHYDPYSIVFQVISNLENSRWLLDPIWFFAPIRCMFVTLYKETVNEIHVLDGDGDWWEFEHDKHAWELNRCNKEPRGVEISWSCDLQRIEFAFCTELHINSARIATSILRNNFRKMV